MNPHLDLIAGFRLADPTHAVPGITELTEHLHERMASVGETAFQEFAYLQKVAAEKWGAERTSHFAIVLRKARVAPKAAKISRWKMTGAAIERLPSDWRPALRSISERSEAGKCSKGSPIWSSDYLGAVMTALCRYVDYATRNGTALVPAGSDLHQYAVWLTDPANEAHGVSVRAAGDYVSRIKAGLGIIAPAAASPARDFVVRYWREKGKASGTPTKTGEQLVGAVTIYDLGFLQMENARNATMRGIRAATTFRNGLILALGIALPQRARAISALELGTTMWVEQPDRLRVRIPARMLKVPEDRKNGDPFDIVWHNPRLVSALDEYRRCFRPLFDGGTCLFPSVHAPDQSISEKRIGKVTGDLTEKELGIRIPIHRLRDNAGTDAAENLVGGRLATAALLDHADIGTGDHYDHSKGVKAAAEFGQFIDSRRSIPTDLVL
jgi:integrase